MNKRDLQRFNQRAIRTKSELLEAIDEYINRIEQNEDIEIVRKGRAKPLANLMQNFREKVAKTPLANLDKKFCAYRVEITDTEIELIIEEFKDIVFDDDGEMKETISEFTPEIIVVTAPYVPIEQFAKEQGVKTATVRQWIRRGKIRNVQKVGSEWMVASTEGAPERGFTSGAYYCVKPEGDMSKLFPLKEGTHSIELWKMNSSSEECLATMRDVDYNVLDEIKLNRTSREKLEHALAASPEVRFQSTFVDGIESKVFNGNPSELEQITHSNEKESLTSELCIEELLRKISGDNYVRNLAISLAHLCFRNGPVEDMHAAGKLNDSDMMVLNKYMVDHLGLFVLLLGLSDFSSLKRILWFHDQCGSDWDDPDISKLLREFRISSERVKALTLNRDQAGSHNDSSSKTTTGILHLNDTASLDHTPDEPLDNCPICGSNILIRNAMTSLPLALTYNKTIRTNKELAQAAHVPIQLVTDMQYVERVEKASEKQLKRMEVVADTLDTPLEHLVSFDPITSTVRCSDCNTSAPWFVWNARRK